MTKRNFEKSARDGALPDDVGFAEVEVALAQTVRLFDKAGVIPCLFPLPRPT